jgi:hypothetical protein
MTSGAERYVLRGPAEQHGHPSWSGCRRSSCAVSAGQAGRDPHPGRDGRTRRVVKSQLTIYRRTAVAKEHGSSVKNDKQYEGLRKKGMSKSRAAAISNSSGSSSRGGKSSGSSQSRKSSGSGGGGNRAQK